MATKKTSTKFDTAHNIETEADLTNKTATVKNLVTGETYAGGGEGLPDISAGDAGKVLAVSDELAAEWVEPNPYYIITESEGKLVHEEAAVSYNDILQAITSGLIPVIKEHFTSPDVDGYLSLIAMNTDHNMCSTYWGGSTIIFAASTADAQLTYYD